MDAPLLSDPPSTTTKASTFGRQIWVFAIAIPGLVLTTALSALLLRWASTTTTFTGAFYNNVINNRASFQLLVQCGNEVLIRRNKALSLVPAALWTGALTPVVATEVRDGDFSIPYYGPDPESKYWNQTTAGLDGVVNRSSYGSFSYNPTVTILGSLLDNAAVATAPNSLYQTHRKLDNTGYTFLGRSYGIGSSVGLAEVPWNDNLQSFTFLESGFMSNITCWYNYTMDFHVEQDLADNDGYPYMWSATGHLSDGGFEYIRMPGFGDSEVVALLGHNPQWGMATGQNASKYAQLNQTSCEVNFNKQTFVAAVDVVKQVISIQPVSNETGIANLTATSWNLDMSQLADNLVEEIGLMVSASGALIFSPLGGAFISNIANTNASQANGFLPSTLNISDLALHGIASSLESMIDDILIAFSSAQFIIAGENNNGRMSSHLTATLAAVKIGDERFIVCISIINAVIVLLFVFEAVRNRGWKSGTLFDYRDLKCLVIGTTLGGAENMRIVEKKLRDEERFWVANPADLTMGKLEIGMKSRGGALALVLGENKIDLELVERAGADEEGRIN
ncbi:hypothetical protein MMC27_000426 [Xylographa pallens]|nr:hypothetical protein [Xylographa pallens]